MLDNFIHATMTSITSSSTLIFFLYRHRHILCPAVKCQDGMKKWQHRYRPSQVRTQSPLGCVNVCTKFQGNPSDSGEIFQSGPKWWADWPFVCQSDVVILTATLLTWLKRHTFSLSYLFPLVSVNINNPIFICRRFWDISEISVSNLVQRTYTVNTGNIFYSGKRAQIKI